MGRDLRFMELGIRTAESKRLPAANGRGQRLSVMAKPHPLFQ